MKKTDIVMYYDIMEEIKRRTKAMDFFLWGKGHALYEATTLESVGLQIRKALHTDGKKRRSFLAMLSASGDLQRYSKQIMR